MTERVEEKIDGIRRQLDLGEYTIAAKESAGIIEFAFRELYRRSIGLLAGPARQRVFKVEQEIGKGSKTLDDFTMGQLVHVYRASDFLEAWSKSTGNQLRGIQMINLDEIVHLRNEFTHSSREATRSEADLLFHCVQSILETFGILSLELAVEVSQVPASLNGTSSSTPARRPRSAEHGHKSAYSPVEHEEVKRLSIQGSRTAHFDHQLFADALEGRPANDARLYGLDIGCADGTVTVDRFDNPVFSRVLGVDNNEAAIAAAKSKHGGDRFKFACLDMEGVSADADLRECMREQELPGFDIVFAALSLHHLANPIKVLRLARYLMHPGGTVIVRSADDGVKIAYPDPADRLGTLIDATMRQPGVSDRQHGRKIYHQLYRAGFRDISISIQTTHTDGMSAIDRHALFLESFAYRRNYLLQAVKNFPDDKRLQDELVEMDSTLEELDLDFEDDSFFYLEMDIAGVARLPWA